MALNINRYGDITPREAGYIAKKLLERGQYDLITERFGQSRPIPKKNTKTIKFRRYESLPRATAPLAEGVPPAGRKLTYTDINATLDQYGDFVEITDVVFDTHPDGVADETKDLCAEQIAETVEVLRIAVMKAGTNVYYANSAASRTYVDSPPLRSDLRRIYRAFKRNKARTIANIVKASALISTEPVAPAFFALGSTDLDADIRNIEGFVPTEKYSNSDRALPGEIGKVDQFRFILSALFEPWLEGGASGTTYLSGGDAVSSAASCDVYPLIIVARDAYGIVPLQGENSVTPMVKYPTPSVGDQLGQKGFVSWKTYQTSVILNHNWIARLECAATAKPT
jgi:N4-gp56 family major capsid protein